MEEKKKEARPLSLTPDGGRTYSSATAKGRITTAMGGEMEELKCATGLVPPRAKKGRRRRAILCMERRNTYTVDFGLEQVHVANISF